MVSVTSLWLPILVSAIGVFVVSSIIHMVMTYHRHDYSPLPQEDAVMDALRGFNIPPGEYSMPYAGSAAAMKDPAVQAKMAKGPMALMTIWPAGPPQMGSNLIQWFIYSLIVGVFAAYVAGRALGPGADYLAVFRFTGVTAFCCYVVAQWQQSIWWRRSWGATFRHTVDGLVYALVTAGVFGTFWP